MKGFREEQSQHQVGKTKQKQTNAELARVESPVEEGPILLGINQVEDQPDHHDLYLSMKLQPDRKCILRGGIQEPEQHEWGHWRAAHLGNQSPGHQGSCRRRHSPTRRKRSKGWGNQRWVRVAEIRKRLTSSGKMRLRRTKEKSEARERGTWRTRRKRTK